MILQTTFELTFRQCLLDVIYGQWGTLGAPFSDRGPQNEVIDPEALLWCSLEFLPTEPRLTEAVLEWLNINGSYVVRQRVYKIRDQKDPRSVIWQAIDRRQQASRIELGLPSEPCHGQNSPDEVVQFSRNIAARKPVGRPSSARLGHFANEPSTLLLKSRDLLGNDLRHFLLVFLLANPHGGKIRDIQSWSGHSYRGLAEAATSWQVINVATLDRGYCRLTTADPFCALLQINAKEAVLVNWLTIFEICIRLLRDLAKARRKGFDEASTVASGLTREAEKTITSSWQGFELAASLRHLLSSFPQVN